MKINLARLLKLFPLLILFFLSKVQAQEKIDLPGTDIKIVLPDGFSVEEGTAAITNPNYSILFMEMKGVNFDEQIKDFKDIDKDYAEKGIKVLSQTRVTINKYEALRISLDIQPAIQQIFFGDDSFCAIINITANSENYEFNQKEIDSVLNSVEYSESEISPLEEHAKFTIAEDNTDWNFISYTMSIFAFESTKTEDALMLMQLPKETLGLVSEEDLANQFISKFKNEIPGLEATEEGPWEINGLNGFRVILKLGEENNEHLGMIYVFVFGSEKSTFALQGMGKKNDEVTKNRFEGFLNAFSFKK